MKTILSNFTYYFPSVFVNYLSTDLSEFSIKSIPLLYAKCIFLYEKTHACKYTVQNQHPSKF